MRYWAYINNQVCGPVEIAKLPELADFKTSSLICPEVPAGAEAVAWKEAKAYPEVMAVLDPASAPAPVPAPAPAPAPAPEQPRTPAAESPLMMTMRGTLIETMAANEPAAPPAAKPAPAAESPLMMTMRGTLIEPTPSPAPAKAADPVNFQPPGQAPAAAPAAQDPQPDQLKQKLDQISAMMTSIANTQSQLLDRLGRVETAVTDMKALLFPSPPRKD